MRPDPVQPCPGCGLPTVPCDVEPDRTVGEVTWAYDCPGCGFLWTRDVWNGPRGTLPEWADE